MTSETLEWFLGADVAYSYSERGNTPGHQRPSKFWYFLKLDFISRVRANFTSYLQKTQISVDQDG